MKSAPPFFALRANTMNACSPKRESIAIAQQTWVCTEGPHPKPNAQIVDVWLQERTPPDRPLNFLMLGGVPLVHRELLSLLGEDNIERDLYVGRVFGRGDKLLEDWVTARGRRRVILRGVKEASYRLCPDCGRILYSSHDDCYLFPAPPPETAIFESSLFGLVVTREIGERVLAEKRARKWRRIAIDPLQILDPPPDGFGVLPGTERGFQ